jgi:hypothetical protein
LVLKLVSKDVATATVMAVACFWVFILATFPPFRNCGSLLGLKDDKKVKERIKKGGRKDWRKEEFPN